MVSVTRARHACHLIVDFFEAMPNRYLASDLDGTLIPPVIDADRAREISLFGACAAEARLGLAYITGRHAELAIAGIELSGLPFPDRIFCDVGTSLYVRDSQSYVLDEAFRHAMTETLGMATMPEIRRLLRGIDGLVEQEADKQAEFKLSYYVRGAERGRTQRALARCLEPLAARVTIITSDDPVTGDGLVDILPKTAGKRRALEWLGNTVGLDRDAILFAGDSGNDRDAMLSGHPAVLVGNAPDELRADLIEAAERTGLADRLYCARAHFAAGVLEGCRHFGFL